MATTPFTVGMTGTTEISPAVAAVLSASFQVPLQNRLYSQITIAQLAADANKTAFSFSKVNLLSDGSLPTLDEYTDPDSTPMGASVATLNASEIGRVVTVTSRLDAISGGAAGRQAAAAVGQDAAATLDKYAATVLAAGTNAIFAGSAGTSAGLAGTDVMSKALMVKAYSKLAKAGAMKTADGYFLAMLTTDQIADLKLSAAVGDWTDVNKYSRPEQVMSGELGAIYGFKVIEINSLPVVNQSGGTNDVSTAVFFGVNALGQGVSIAPRLGVAFTDKMNRFAHYSWYAMMIIGIIDQAHVFVVKTATSFGNNAA